MGREGAFSQLWVAPLESGSGLPNKDPASLRRVRFPREEGQREFAAHDVSSSCNCVFDARVLRLTCA